MKTYYLKLKSCSNLACETQTIDTRDHETQPAFLLRVQRHAKAWGLGNGSTSVEVSVQSYGGDCIVSTHAVAIDRPAPKPKCLTATLHLETREQFWAVLEALQQYIDNSHDADYIIEDSQVEEFNAKLEAAEAFRDQLDAVLASLAD